MRETVVGRRGAIPRPCVKLRMGDDVTDPTWVFDWWLPQRRRFEVTVPGVAVDGSMAVGSPVGSSSKDRLDKDWRRRVFMPAAELFVIPISRSKMLTRVRTDA